jgi:hypothetical protein
MAWGIYEIEQIVLSIRCQIVHRNRMTFDGNAAFALQVHGIQKLFLHFPLHHRLGTLEESVGQSGLAVIDVSDDTKISNPLCFHHEKELTTQNFQPKKKVGN